MRHAKVGRKLGVTPAHRRALGKNLLQGLIDNERIITTVPKAKEFKPLAERVIHLAKTKNLTNIRRVASMLGSRRLQIDWYDDAGKKDKIQTTLQKLFEDIGPRNKERTGGYTRIIRLAKRRVGDATERCIFELVESDLTENISKGKAKAAAKSEGGAAPAGAK